MALPVASALGRRERLWPAVTASAAAHALVVIWALVRAPPPPIDLEQKPIVARLVRLGEKRPEEWLPRKEQPPPPAPPAPPSAAPAVPSPAKPTAPAPNAKAPPAPPAPSAGGKAGGTTLASVLSKVQRQVEESRWGSPDGDPMGDSETASEGDRYFALVERAIKANYRVPATIPERERLYLQTTVALWIAPDGRIARWKQERSSGNATFDAAVERTMAAAPRLPPPPDNLRRTGIQLVFKANDT